MIDPALVARLEGCRIVFVLPSMELGGAERQAVLLARYLRDEEGAHVHVWGLGTDGVVPGLCDETGLEWHAVHLPPPGARVQQVRALVHFVRALRRVKPDILLPYSRVPNRVCGLLWRYTGARLCVWNHRAGAVDLPPRRVDQWAVRRTPVFVANSEHGATYLVETYGVAKRDVHVVRNGVALDPPQRSRADWRRHLGVDEETFLACMLANLTHNKDHATLLHAWRKVSARLAGTNRAAVLLLAGRPGDTYASLQSLAGALDLRSSVRFLGHVTDVAGLLQAVDAAVFASDMEGSPNGVLECMSAGLPVVGTDIDGIREAVGPEGAPYLAPLRDADRFADLVLSFANDPRRREQAGRANRRRVEEAFGPREMGACMAAICAAHLARRG